ncbi:hypothetical protein GOP47_0019087 [Adiantum capillus-veneris]|uniref:Probable RNA polymerase II nuclear localization protein SLC7A6OS n=1 Tax=Adiantum capillus-veneris TaxID=13818 RepID=A0A9D4UEE7_ADICA|nr:hypothetical protein GOP47_0019087 [Adiantum capillus-veneris]
MMEYDDMAGSVALPEIGDGVRKTVLSSQGRKGSMSACFGGYARQSMRDLIAMLEICHRHMEDSLSVSDIARFGEGETHFAVTVVCTGSLQVCMGHWTLTMVEIEPSLSSAHLLATVGDKEGDMSKPPMVRIKRKRLQLPIESLWLEVSERPTKRLEAELCSFSLNDSNIQGPHEEAESKSSRLLFHHVDTVNSFGREETTKVNSLLREIHEESSKEKHRIWPKSKHGKLSASTSREKHQKMARKARFEQVWRKRKGVTKQDNLSELFHLYDIVRVDLEADILDKQESEAENRLLQDFLPLFKDYLPSVAAEVESSTMCCMNKEEDEYVYDVYALGDEANGGGDTDTSDYPLIQVVDDEDLMWGASSESQHDSEDSNDENNPLNDYPEEEDDSDVETDSALSRSAVAERKQSAVLDASEEYGCDAAEEWEENWGSAGNESDEGWE